MATAYRLGRVAELLGVSVDTVRRLADRGELTTQRTEGGHRVVDGADLAAFVAAQAPDTDAEVIVGQSARNRFLGVVTAVEVDRVAATVEIQAGPHRVVSLMTAEAVAELGLAPGSLAVAAVKATNVMVETPEAR